ncbi:hypothetical protein Tco_0634630 [Tanacetum coccineum]
MEVGFLLGNNTAKKGGLVSKVKNIEGKPLGKDGKPLKSSLKNVSSKTKQVKPVRDKSTQSVMDTQCVDLVIKTYLISSDMKSTPAAFVTENIQNGKDTATNNTNPNDLGVVLDGANKGGDAEKHNAKTLAFSETGLSLIATQLGRPIRLDACTSDICLNPWGRNSYAQILVKLNSKNEVMESIVDYDCPSKIRKAMVSSSYGNGGVCDTNGKNKGAKPKVSHEVRINDSSCSTNENGYFKDGIDLGQLQGNMKKLMDENKVLELNTDCVTEDVAEVHSVPNANMISTKSKSISVEVNECVKGSLLEQFLKSRDASMSKQNKFSESDESEVEEVSMPFGKPGGGFLDELEDDLDRHDGYKAHVYDLTEQEQAFCDRYDIRLNSRCKK